MHTPTILWINFLVKQSDIHNDPYLFFSDHFVIDKIDRPLLSEESIKQGVNGQLPDFICFEYDYPDLTGLKRLQQIKRQFPSIPILMVTEQHSESLAVWAFRTGVWDYLVKPVSAEEMLRVVNSMKALQAKRGSRMSRMGSGRALVDRQYTFPDEVRYQGNLPKEESLTRALSHVEKNLGQKISEHKVAQLCGMSSFQFSRLFKQAYGITFQEYVIKLRIHKASQLLRNPQASITDIAYTVGFKDPSYFSRTFKRYTSMNPSDFREHNCPEVDSDLPLSLLEAVV